MTRTIAILRRLRTVELNRLKPIAEFAAAAAGGAQPDIDLREVRAKLDIAQAHFEKISQFDFEILEHPDLSVDDLDLETNKYDEHRVLGLRCLADLKNCLHVEPPSASPAENAIPAPIPNPVPSNVTNRESPSVEELLQLDPLPTCTGGNPNPADVTPEPFDGNRLHYRSFMAQFRNWIDRKKRLTSLDKLIVLRKLLRGDAKALVESLEISETNFDVALGLLEQAFGQVDIERQQIMSTLFRMPRMRSPSDFTGLRTVLNIVQSCIQRMASLGAPLSEIALAVEPALLSSIPSELVFEYSESVGKSSSCPANRASSESTEVSSASTLSARTADEIGGLIDYLRRFANHRERTALILRTHRGSEDREQRKTSRDTSPLKKNHRHRSPPPRSQRSTVVAVARSQAQARTCFFCRGPGHKPSQCSANLSLDRRHEILDRLKRCRRCFRFRHDENTRCQGPRDTCARCKSQDHYTAMCPPEPRPTVSAVTSTNAAAEETAMVLLHTASVHVISGAERIPARLFLDGGSSATFVQPSLLRALPACEPISTARMAFTTFTDERELLMKQYQITLESVHDAQRVDIKAFEYDFKANPSPQCSERDRRMIEEFGSAHVLADTALARNVPGPPVSILIGRDQFFKVARVGQEKRLDGELVARGSVFGWIIGGAAEASDVPRPELIRTNVHCCVASITRSARDLEKLWQLEAIGIEKEETSPLSADENSAIRQFKNNLRYEAKQYTVSMPRRPGIEELPNNFPSALNRLRNKLRSLRRAPETYARYHREVMAFVDQGHAEGIEDFPVDVKEFTVAQGHRYFMPHHNVVTKTSQGEKWRIVFDCSSSGRGGRSLNSFLLAGPNLNPDIIKVLLNFRLHAIALSADIAKAYLCINVVEEDRPLFQFLWQGPDDDCIRCYQMRRVTWGATPSGFLLAGTLREHFAKVDPESSLRLGDSFYHDDFLRSFPAVSEAQRFVNIVQDHLSSASMELAKWKTNSRALAEHLTSRGVSEAALNLDAGRLLKVLGLSWLPTEDTFQFDLEHVVSQVHSICINTKRLVLKIVASIYDPLGWLAPFLIRGKLILRDLWSVDLRWDDAVDEKSAAGTKRWTSEIASLSNIRVPRCISTGEIPCVDRRLHVFGDASPLAYAAVAYMQTVFADGSSKTSIIISKTRLAPRQPVSLPRLELMASVLAVRLRDYITHQLAVPVTRVMFYTDSMVTYHWCTSPSLGRWKTFVANRVAEIQSSSKPSEWRHVPGSQNTADLATRGISAEELNSSPNWWRGPEWLSLPESDWPTSQPGQSVEPELGPAQSEMRHKAVAALVKCAQHPSVFDIRHFSSLGRAARTIEYVFLAIRIMRRRPLLDAVAARSEALAYLIKTTQRELFPQEVEAAVADDDAPRSSRLSGFKLFLDEAGLLRARTRLREGIFFTEDEKNPVVIPGQSHLAALLITAEHRIHAHLGVQSVLAALRKRYWITRARQRIRSILSRCVTCKRQHGRSLKVVEAPLPASRLSPVVPFKMAGLDFCGPFLTRERDSTQKCYIALFSCSTVRAVHLELVPSMSTPQTHLAIRRFLSLYPECTSFWSDNARSLVKAATDIKRLFNSDKNPDVKSLLADRGLHWDFSCPRAPWENGFIERVVGTTKAALKRTLGRSLLTFEELRTVVSEIAATVNDRPLTYVSEDPDDFTPLTPSHFLRGAPQRSPLCTVVPLEELNQRKLRNEHLNRTTYYRSLVKRWRSEYITQLRSANMTAGRGSPIIKAGDVCLLEDDGRPRGAWTLVRVQEAHTGRDGNVRTYSVKFPNGYVTRRAARQLCPLEVA